MFWTDGTELDKLGNETWVTVRPNVPVTFNSEDDG